MPTDKIPAPEPGIYPDVDFDTYKSWDAMNLSTLCHGKVSMQHLKAAIDGVYGVTDTEDRLVGRGFHCMSLEGMAAFNERFIVAQPCCGVIKDKKSPRVGQESGSASSARLEDRKSTRLNSSH